MIVQWQGNLTPGQVITPFDITFSSLVKLNALITEHEGDGSIILNVFVTPNGGWRQRIFTAGETCHLQQNDLIGTLEINDRLEVEASVAHHIMGCSCKLALLYTRL